MKTLILSSLGCGNYIREETVQGRKLFVEVRYTDRAASYTLNCPEFYSPDPRSSNTLGSIRANKDLRHFWLSPEDFY